MSAICLDVGSGVTKVGYAGEDTPHATFATRVAIGNSSGGLRDDSTAQYFVGNDLASQLPYSTKHLPKRVCKGEDEQSLINIYAPHDYY